jgi:nitrogen fixation NifU-like protein
MLSDLIIGRKLDEVRDLGKEDLLDELGIDLGPVRLKCALLPLKVVKVGAYGIEGWHEGDARSGDEW